MNLTLDGIREGEYREITAQEWRVTENGVNSNS